MPFALDTPRLAANTVASPMGVEHVGKAAKGFHGQSIHATTDQSPIGKVVARRQITQKQINQMSLQRLIVAPRRIGQGTNAEVAAARIAEFYDKLPNMPTRAELRRLIDFVRKYQDSMRKEKAKASEIKDEDEEEDEDEDEEAAGAVRRGARQAIAGALEKFDSDVSHQFAALEILMEELEEDEEDPDFQAALDDVAQYFNESEIAQDVRAGMAAARAASEAAETLKTDPAAIRNAYRSLLRQEMNFAKLFDALLKFDPLKNCEAVMDTFCLAAGTDLTNLTGPSTDRTLLQALMSELGKLKKLRAVLDGCGKLVEDVEPALDKPHRGLLKATDVASRVLNFIARPTVSVKDALALLGRLADVRAGAKLIFFNGLEYLLVLIPDDMFPNMQARLTQKQLLRKVNERLVEEEDEEFAREEDAKKGKLRRKDERGKVR